MRSIDWRHIVVIGAGYGLGAAALTAGLPEEKFSPPYITAFLLPTAAALIDTGLRRLVVRDPAGLDATHALAAYDAIMLRVVLFLMGVHATVLAGLLGLFSGRAWAAQIVPVMLGATMIGIGNLLPR